MADENDRPDGAISFDINADYQSTYLKSNYESDDYHELKVMEENLNDVVINRILSLDNFASLRPLKAEDLKIDQEVKVFNEKKARITKKINSDTFLVKFNNGDELEVKIDSIEPPVDPIMKLKKPQLEELYVLCHDILFEKSGQIIDIVNFFYVFTEYFRVNERYLFACLEPKTQAFLLEEIKKRTGMKFSKGINPIFKSS